MLTTLNTIRSRMFWCALFIAPLLSGAGCVQRRMTIKSNPPGALVYVDDYQIGTTPVSTDFIYYGTRKIRLVKDGYETLTVRQPIPLPWYQIFPLDFVTENIWPGEIRDERVVDLSMLPAASVAPEEVVARAQQLRAGNASLPPVPLPPPAAPRLVTPQPIPAAPLSPPGFVAPSKTLPPSLQQEPIPSAPTFISPDAGPRFPTTAPTTPSGSSAPFSAPPGSPLDTPM